MDEFVAYRTVGSELQTQWSGQMAHLFEPGELELSGEVKGVRFTARGPESISCESLTAWFNTQTLMGLAGESKFKRAELKRFVEVSAGGNLLLTDYAEFDADSNVLKSDKAVKLEGLNRRFEGEKGFQYEVSGDKLELFGKITGTLTLSEDKKMPQ